MKREKFGSRMGFILVSAGCAIGIGNVWKFPYMCGEYGGAAFILIYLVFLLILGIPVLTCEFAIGRGSGLSVAAGFEKLEPEGTVACHEMGGDRWKLSAHDVLYHGRRLDALLLLPQHLRRICGCICRRSIRRILGYAGKRPGHDLLDGPDLCRRFCGLPVRNPKGN